MIKGVHTTGSIAKMLRVSNQTVTQWTDNKLLKCAKIGGSRTRKIYDSHLETFLRDVLGIQPLKGKSVLDTVANETYLTTSEVAELFALKPAAVLKRCKNGSLSGFCIPSRLNGEGYEHRIALSSVMPQMEDSGAYEYYRKHNPGLLRKYNIPVLVLKTDGLR